MNKAIIPIESIAEINFLSKENLKGWKNFAHRITHNPFVKKYLFKRDGNKCSWCNRDLTQGCNIHHITYAHYCTYDVSKEIHTPTDKRPNRTRIVPDCESCRKNNEERFLTCMSKLSLVHGPCNQKIEIQRKLKQEISFIV